MKELLSAKPLLWVLAAYVSIAPIFWVPGFPVTYVKAVKYVLLACLVGVSLLHQNRRMNIQFTPVLWSLILAFVLSAVGVVVKWGDFEAIANTAKYTLLPLLLIISLGKLVESKKDFYSVALITACISIGYCLYAYFMHFTGRGLGDGYGVSLAVDVGFLGVKRTGWSGAAACLVVFFFYISYVTEVKKAVRWTCFFAAILLFSSQVLVAGRGGMLASVIGIGAAIWFSSKRHHYVFLALLATIVCIVYSDAVKSTLRITRENKANQDLNDISAGRLGQYEEALVTALSPENALLGVTTGPYSVGSNGVQETSEIHNVFLNASIRYGLIYGALILFVTFYISAQSLKVKNPNIRGVLVVSIIAPVFVMLFEPNAVWRSPTSYIVWWLMVSIAFTQPSIRKLQKHP